jgi:hypothetical protein
VSRTHAFGCAAIVIMTIVPAASAQPQPQPQPETPAAQPDLEDLQDDLEDLRSELTDLKEQVAAQKPPRSLTALNPQITAFLNGASRFDDRAVLTPSGARIDDRLFLRTAEIDFRAAVDPYADAVAIVALEGEPDGGFDADLEEGYVILKRLPILESAPLGLKLKVGRYRAPIGAVNRLHMHDLPWTTRPLPIARLLGTENGEFFESGFNPVGLDAEVMLPELSSTVVQELNVDLVDGGQIAVTGQDPDAHRHLGYLGHYNLFFTLHDTHDVNVGLSGYVERGDRGVQLASADIVYKWKPLAAGEFHSVVLGGEVFWARTETRTSPLAAFAFAQYQLGWHTYVGARYDYAQDLDDDRLADQVAAGYVSYYTSEFLRFRAGYEHRSSDNPADDGVSSAIAEVNVVFGSHPTEPYWVNR